MGADRDSYFRQFRSSGVYTASIPPSRAPIPVAHNQFVNTMQMRLINVWAIHNRLLLRQSVIIINGSTDRHHQKNAPDKAGPKNDNNSIHMQIIIGLVVF